MRYYFYILLITILLLLGCNNKYDLDDLDVIKIDKKHGNELNNESKNILKEILYESHSLLKDIKCDTIKNPEWLFKSISYFIESKKILTTKQKISYPFSIALNKKSFNCMNWVIIFLEIAKQNNLPIYAIDVPKHIFLVWNNGKNKYYWETMSDESVPLTYYIQYFNISKEDIDNKVYLQELRYDEVLLYYLLDMYRTDESKKLCESLLKSSNKNPVLWSVYANYFNEKGNYQESIKCYDSALKYSHTNFIIMNNYAAINYELDKKEIAIKIWNKILELDTLHFYIEGCLNKCQIFEENKEYNRMLDLTEKYLPNFPAENDLWNFKATAMFHLKGVDSALFYLDKSFSLDSTYYDTYLIKEEILSKNKRTMDAINILHSALKNCEKKDEIMNELVKIYKHEKMYQTGSIDLAKQICNQISKVYK